MKTTEIFSKGQKVSINFTGEAWLSMLSEDIKNLDTTVYNVTFAPGSRNHWHSHPYGQILLCTSGEGYYQEKGQPKRRLKAGDIIEIKPNVVHWHGATPHSDFVHIGITPQASRNNAVWLGPVSEEEYESY